MFVGDGVLDVPLRDAFTCKASLFQKQSTGLFLKFTLAKRLRNCGALPHTPPEALPLDSAKGTQSLWNPIHGYINLIIREKKIK